MATIPSTGMATISLSDRADDGVLIGVLRSIMLALARVHLLVPRTSRPFCLVLAPITINKKQIFQFQFHHLFQTESETGAAVARSRAGFSRGGIMHGWQLDRCDCTTLRKIINLQ